MDSCSFVQPFFKTKPQTYTLSKNVSTLRHFNYHTDLINTSLFAKITTQIIEATNHLDTLVINDDTDVSTTPKPHRKKNCLAFNGILLAAMAGFLLSINSLIIKSLYSVNSAELTLFRYVSSIVYSLPCLFYNNVSLQLKRFAYILAFRSLIGVVCSYLIVVGNQTLVLTDSNVIAISTPVFVAFFGRVLLKEKVNRASGIALALTVLGVIIVSRIWTFTKDSDSEIVLGTVAALGSISLMAISMIIVRKMAVSGVHASAIVFHHGWMSCFTAVGLTAATDGFQLLNCEWKFSLSSYQRLVIIGLSSFVVQILINTACKFEKALTVALVKCSIQISAVFVWQYVFFDKVPSVLSYVGAVLVLIGSFTMYFAIWVNTWDNASVWKKRFQFLTK